MQIIVSLYCLGTSDKNRKAGQVQDTHTHYVLSQISLTHSWLTPWHISITTGKASFSVRDSPADSATSLKEIWVGMVMAGEKKKDFTACPCRSSNPKVPNCRCHNKSLKQAGSERLD